jgi:trimeric autotransporter adhesin
MKRGLNKENSLPDPEFGGESSESARAIHYVVQKDTLMTYVSARFAQADPGIVSGSTIERKKMSTKTSFKRVALVAVAALGAGVLSVAPANATITGITLTPTSSTIYATVGTLSSTTVRLAATPADITGKASFTVTSSVTSKPGTSDGAFATSNSSGKATMLSTGAAAPFVVTGTTAASGTAVVTETSATVLTIAPNASGAQSTSGGVVFGTFGITPATAGTYVYTLTPSIGTATTITVRAYPTSAQATAAALAGANSQIVSVLGDGGTPASTLSVVGVAGPANTVQVAAIGDATLPRIVTVSGAGTYFTAAGTGVTLGSGTNPTTATVTATSNYGTLTIATPTVGTATVSIASESAAGSGIYGATAETVSITVNAAATSGAVNAATSTAFMNKSATVTAATTEATAPLTTPARPADANQVPVVAIQVTVGRANGAITGTTAVTASITGPGVLKMSANDTDPDNTEVATGRSISSTAATMLAGNDVFSVGVIPDGVAGVSTVTITVGTYTVTKTVTFVGTVASLAFTKVRGSIVDTADGVVTGDTDAYAGFITGRDAAGNAVTLTAAEFTAVTAAQRTAADITGAAVVAGTAATYSGVAVVADAPTVVIDPTATKTGNKTLTLTHTATGLTVVATFTVALAKATTVRLSTDKATYAPGEKMTLTLTALDAGGFGIADIASPTSFLAATGIVSSSSITGDALVVTAPALVGGRATFTLYAPLASGPVTFTATTGTGTEAPTTAVTATATATVSQNADISAITTLINSLIAKINALSKLVTKIQKKVRA